MSQYIMDEPCKGLGCEGRSGGEGSPTARDKDWKWAEALMHTQRPGTVMLDSESVPLAVLSRIFPVCSCSPS